QRAPGVARRGCGRGARVGLQTVDAQRHTHEGGNRLDFHLCHWISVTNISTMFSSKIRSGAQCAPKVLTVPLLVSLLLCVLCAMRWGREPPQNPPGFPGDLCGGMEFRNGGVKVIALQFSKIDDDPPIRGIYSKMIRLGRGRATEGNSPPQASTDAAQAV